MKIVQVNDLDLPGRRFNGFDLMEALNDRGNLACQYVFDKHGESENVKSITHLGGYRGRVMELERKHSLHGLLQPYGRLLMETADFNESDIVHYHLIHNHLLSLLDFPDMVNAKHSVWTWHDPWALTGHCVHPLDCQGWETGCSPCPHLDYYFPLKTDTAGDLWRIKEKIYSKMNVDIIVASPFMLDFAQRSPLGRLFSKVHLIPFGIKEDDFGYISREEARLMLGLPKNNFVIAFRSETNEFKGTKYIFQMLEMLKDRNNVSLLVIGSSLPLPNWIKSSYNCMELGWQNDPVKLSAFYSACDVFLMPSIAESFGLMAVEAMASSRPVVVFDCAALPGVTFAPECGVAVPRGDAEALLEAVERLRNDPEERQIRGELGRDLVVKHYRFEDYVSRHEQLYKEIIERKQTRIN